MVAETGGNRRIREYRFSPYLGIVLESGSTSVMANRDHVLFRPLGSREIPKIVKKRKGFTAMQINKKTGKPGSLWQEGGLSFPPEEWG